MTKDDLILTLRTGVSQMAAALADYDASQGATTPTTPVPQYVTALIGDSRFAGTVPNQKINWGALMGGRTDVINMAVAGSTTMDWLNGNSQLGIDPIHITIAKLISYGVKKVIIELGKNNIDAAQSAVQIAHSMQDLVNIIGYWSTKDKFSNGYALKGNANTQIRVAVLGPVPVCASVQNSAAINSTNNQLQSEIPLGAYKIANTTPPGIWYQGFQNMVVNGVLLDQYALSDGVHFSSLGQTTWAPSLTMAESMIPSV